MKRFTVLALLVACANPPLELRFSLTSGESQKCTSDTGQPTSECSDVTMLCPSVLSVRIVPPSDPTVPYISICKPLTAQAKLCSIAGIDLPAPSVPVPEQVLEVQMAVFPRDATLGTDPVTGELICPPVAYGADNLPVAVQQQCDQGTASCPVVPAVGGRTYYYPGDAKTVVQLGCTDLEELQAGSCSNHHTIAASAAVLDFDTAFSVSNALAQRLTVAIGEPRPIGDTYVMLPMDERELPLLASSTPVWQADVDLTLKMAQCIDVSESAAQSTSTVTCELLRTTSPTRIDMTGVRLSKATLDKILTAIGKSSFPGQGLVVGLVLDSNSSPMANATISASGGGSIQYLSDDLSAVSLGNSTTASGVFVSQDATFGSTFDAQNTPMATDSGFGGLIEGKVSIVVIRPKPPSTGG